MAENELEDAARRQIVDLAKKNQLYFVVWHGHIGRYFVALQNNSSHYKSPEIYSVIYESYNDLVENDIEKFRLRIPSRFTWQELLILVKANLPINKSYLKLAITEDDCHSDLRQH